MQFARPVITLVGSGDSSSQGDHMFRRWNASHTVALVGVLLGAILLGLAIGGAEGAKLIAGYIGTGLGVSVVLAIFVGAAAVETRRDPSKE